jgi:hypothetical protein
MKHSPYSVDIALPQDLADMLAEIVIKPVPVRSSLLTLLTDGTAAASTAITFLQGPPAVAYWVDVVKKWLKRKRDTGVGEIRVEGPAGTATFRITRDTDLAELAGTLHKFLFSDQAAPARDIDDIAL